MKKSDPTISIDYIICSIFRYHTENKKLSQMGCF